MNSNKFALEFIGTAGIRRAFFCVAASGSFKSYESALLFPPAFPFTVKVCGCSSKVYACNTCHVIAAVGGNLHPATSGKSVALRPLSRNRNFQAFQTAPDTLKAAKLAKLSAHAAGKQRRGEKGLLSRPAYSTDCGALAGPAVARGTNRAERQNKRAEGRGGRQV